MTKKVADLTPEELRDLIEEVVDEKLVEFLGDPDEGLELREEFVEELKRRRAAIAAGEPTVPLDKVLAELRGR